jgi:hypothetical protein
MLPTLPKLTGEPPIVVGRPVEVMDLRRELVDWWRHEDELRRFMAMQGRQVGSTAMDSKTEGNLAIRWFHGTLRDGELYWVAPDMVRLIEALAPTLPEVHPLPPSPEGFVIMSRPIRGMDAQSGGAILTAAYLWGPAHVETISCVCIETFGWRNIMHPSDPSSGEPAELSAEEMEAWRENMPRLVSTGGSEWPWQALTPDFSHIPSWATGGSDPRRRASMLEDRRLMGTFWSLCQQKLTVERRFSGDRHVQRRIGRAGIPLRDVRVITLRETQPPPEHEGDHQAVDWSHRWLVGGHWRQQPYGPEHSLRRAQWIEPFIKGPPNKPLVIRETVRALKR